MWVPDIVFGNDCYRVKLEIMRIIDNYTARSIVAIFLGTVFTFAFLFILIDTFTNFRRFHREESRS